MNSRHGGPNWFILAGLLGLMGAGAVALWSGPRSVPNLDNICALARQHQFDRAEDLTTRYLRVFPGDNRAHLLMAQFALDRSDPEPQRALDHLGKIQPRTSQEAAVVRFSEGKAYYQQKSYILAESCWKEALKLDPVVPEAGWALLDLLDFEGRAEEAHQLGMRLYESEPDPRDQVRLLLEMSRIDIDRIAPGSQVQVFEPVWRQNSENLPLGVAVGLSLVHDSQSEKGIEVLRTILQQHPNSAQAWDGWLTGLDDGFQPDLLSREFTRLPQVFRTSPRFAKYEGAVAQGTRDWPRAIAAYQRAYAFEPYNGVVLYRLRMAHRAVGETADFHRINQLLTSYQTAFKQMRAVYTEALSAKTLGVAPHTELYHQLATLREQLGRFNEARAWHRLVLRDVPNDALSLAALARLK